MLPCPWASITRISCFMLSSVPRTFVSKVPAWFRLSVPSAGRVCPRCRCSSLQRREDQSARRSYRLGCACRPRGAPHPLQVIPNEKKHRCRTPIALLHTTAAYVHIDYRAALSPGRQLSSMVVSIASAEEGKSQETAAAQRVN